MIFRKKQTYCPSMYIGYNGSCKQYSVMCSRTGEPCIGYEETIADVRRELEILIDDRAKRRKWTDEIGWRLEIGLLTRCPANRARTKLKAIIEEEFGAEKKFFRGEEH